MNLEEMTKKGINTAGWVINEPARHMTIMGDSDICVSLGKMTSKSIKIDKIDIKIGTIIADKLKWKKRDNITVLVNPDNPFQWMLVKQESGSGYVLSESAGVNKKHFRLQFTWKMKNNPLTERKPKPCAYHIQNGNQLIIDAGNVI